jgi:hypothetical protein
VRDKNPLMARRAAEKQMVPWLKASGFPKIEDVPYLIPLLRLAFPGFSSKFADCLTVKFQDRE